MGVVYQARQVKINRLVALKMILGGGLAGQAEVARFLAEAEAVARLEHPNLVRLYEVGEHQGLPYFTMEAVPGGSLARRLDGAPLPANQAAQLVQQLARGMHYAHERGIVHRDLKPANILLAEAQGHRQAASDQGSNDTSTSLPPDPWPLTPKITDFGLAHGHDLALMPQGRTQGLVRRSCGIQSRASPWVRPSSTKMR